MKVAIGILFWNEEESISATIDSIFQQSLLADTPSEVEQISIIGVPNGCTDHSIPRALTAFEKNRDRLKNPKITTDIRESPKGKAVAFNYFVHKFSAADSDYLILVDGDVVLVEENAMLNLIRGLNVNPRAHLATGLPMKHIESTRFLSPWQYLTVSMSRMERNARHYYLSGSLFAGRARFLRKIEFPRGFVAVLDGFVGVMAITNLLTTDYEWDRIVYSEKPTHIFEAYQSPFRLFRHHRRQAIGRAVNDLIYDTIRAKGSATDMDGGEILMQLNSADSEWLNRAIENETKARRYGFIAKRHAMARFSQLRRLSFLKKLLALPLACLGALWDYTVICSANRAFRSGVYRNVWENCPNTVDLSVPENARTRVS